MNFDPDDPDHPIEPYIIMVADAYDAMTSTRSYRKALPQEVAFQELRDKSGTQFHPACAEALIRAIEKRNEVHGKGHEEDSHFENAPEVGLGSAGLGDLLSTTSKARASEPDAAAITFVAVARPRRGGVAACRRPDGYDRRAGVPRGRPRDR